ncbi:Rsd/AlgQ family anti-sigma factor [Halieaceae bacterium IMCC14734]|uniref:Rsd/AlgQ family anti-sigma factor n=1 Tax=Candidatus Litorirhabdus singularis TaxID=2518993 RepID=A0ABT3TB34_9GAMM|nr:Rsd/AlgQ family anti-sigma factor [Candidatus Litorirhabdus singularis]MCX2979508.1 Rsd/AlgQ family anti-sigma factor [Candidatus Litorirhabdus singularis]
MQESFTDNKARWGAVEVLLQKWLRERREILVNYALLAARFSENTAAQEEQQDTLRELCQLLVDYVSVGHFEVFHELLCEAEAFADGSNKLASDIIPSIGDTTEVILGFEEKYALMEPSRGGYTEDLSLLGEILERRFELEDRLIVGLHQTHARAASNS